MTHSGKYTATNDPERFTPPNNWEFTFYSLEPKRFWYSETKLPLFNGCEITRYDFRSPVRFNAGLKKPGLQFSFIDSYSTTASRLQGFSKIDSILMISLGGYDWDALSDVGALGIDIDFDESLASKILTQEALFYIGGMGNIFGSKRSIIVQPSPAAIQLKSFVMKQLAEFDQEHNIDYDDAHSELDYPLLTPPNFPAELADFRRDALMELAKNVLDEIAVSPTISNKIANFSRREIALQIEKILWESPLSRNTTYDISLDEVSAHFNVSRRLVQQTLQEQFGLGFVALRKLIRLHQLRKAILNENGFKPLSTLGYQLYFRHLGRLSRDYKELFGILPSVEKRKPKNSKYILLPD